MLYRIRENFKLIHCKNPISGYEWIEHGPTTSYSVVGPTGEVSRHKSDAAAQKARNEWETYGSHFFAKEQLCDATSSPNSAPKSKCPMNCWRPEP